jgi:hypothetical protein
MNSRIVRQAWLVLSLVAVGAAQPAHAQTKARLHGGIIQPVASTSDYFKFGPSVGVDLAFPLQDRLDLMLDLGWDYLNMTDIYPTPTTNLWRYGVGLEADLLGDTGSEAVLLKGVFGGGATTVRSHQFWLESRKPYTFQGETINQTSLTASGGLRLGVRAQNDLVWWLTGRLTWMPVQDRNADALKELARNQLDPLGSALGASITLGISLW